MSPKGLVKLPADAPVEEILEILDRDGGLIIKGIATPDTLEAIAAELKPYEQPDQSFKGNFFPQTTKLICGVVGKSPTLASKLLLHPLYREVCKRKLSVVKKSRYGDSIRTWTSRPVANGSTTFNIGPGAAAQQLHRDDAPFYLDHPLKQSAMLGMLVAETRTTAENGATVLIPGSHKWGDDITKTPPRPEDAIPACLEPGEALLFDGAVFHGGGANVTAAERRKVHGVFMVQGQFRPEENIYLAFPPEVASKYPDEVLQAYGYQACGSGLGWVDYKEPMSAVLGREVENKSLQFGEVRMV